MELFSFCLVMQEIILSLRCFCCRQQGDSMTDESICSGLRKLYRAVAPTSTPCSVSSAELNFSLSGDGVWHVDVGETACGVVVFSNRTLGGEVGLELPEGAEGSDFVSLNVFSASEEDLKRAGWVTKPGSDVGPASFLAPTCALPVESLSQDPASESGLLLGDVSSFDSVWSEPFTVHMKILCTDPASEEKEKDGSCAQALDPHITMVRRVMDACVSSSYGGAVVVGELLSRYFVLTNAASMVVACRFPSPVRYFVHGCLSGLESITPSPLEVVAARAAKQALLSDSIAVHIKGMDVAQAKDRQLELTASMSRRGLPGLHYARATASKPVLVLFDINVSEEFSAFMCGLDGVGAGAGADGAGAGVGAGAISSGSEGLDAVAFDGGPDNDGDAVEVHWIPLVMDVDSLPTTLASVTDDGDEAKQCKQVLHARERNCLKQTKHESGLCFWHRL